MRNRDGLGMGTLLRRSAGLAGAFASDVVMLVWSDGLQGTARRNAWSGMVEDSRRAQDRAAAQATLALVQPELPEALAVPGS